MGEMQIEEVGFYHLQVLRFSKNGFGNLKLKLAYKSKVQMSSP